MASRKFPSWIDGYVAYTQHMGSPPLHCKWGAIAAIVGALERKVWVGNHYETRKIDVIQHERVALESGATLNSGDLVEVELLVRSDNDYRYVVFEDFAELCKSLPARLRDRLTSRAPVPGDPLRR